MREMLTWDNRVMGAVRTRGCSLGVALMVVAGLVAGCGHTGTPVLIIPSTFYLRPVDCVIPLYGASSTTSATPSIVSPSVCRIQDAASLESTRPAAETAAVSVILPYYDNAARYVLGPADMDGRVIGSSIVIQGQGSGYQVQVTLTSQGAAEFDKIAALRYPYYQQDQRNPPYQSMEAFEVDGVVWEALVIQASSFNGRAIITGALNAPFTKGQADALAHEVDAAR
jgi:hypothetical protein